MVTTSGSATPTDTTVQPSSRPATEPAGAPQRTSWHRTLLTSGWIPAALVAAVTVVTLVAFETPVADIAVYAGYLTLGLAVPGTLLWRALRGTPRSFVEDVAAGTTLVYAVELLVYFSVSALGVPQLVRAWPAVVVVAFVAVPKLRRHLRPTGTPRMPMAWSWSVAGTVVIALLWLAWSGFLTHALSGPTAGNPYVDMPFHLSLAADLKHHFPPKIPYVLGEPQSYHWFVHAHLAASSWSSGLELHVLLYRFYAVPLVVLLVVLIAVLASRVSRRIWAGPVAAALLVFVGSFSPYAFQWVGSPFAELNLFTPHIWGSPTQTFGTVLFLPLLLLLSDRLRHAPGRAGQWVMFTILLIATMGGKATFLPILLAGLAFAGFIGLVAERRIHWPLVIAFGLTSMALLYAQRVLFNGADAGLAVHPFFSSELVAGTYMRLPPTWFVALCTLLIPLAWAGRAAGIIGLLRRRERWSDPTATLFAGIVIGAVVAYFSFSQPGGSQFYFIRSMAPVLAVLSAWGLTTLVPPERDNRRVAAALLGSAVLGGAVMTAVIMLGSDQQPAGHLMNRREIALALITPYLVLGVIFAVLGAALFLARRRVPWLRGISLALAVALVLGLGLTRLIPYVRYPVEYIDSRGGLVYSTMDSARSIAPGAVEAGRWIRAHSDPDDLVATNVHCRHEYMGNCDNRHFWIAAYTERRVLVEGWGYTVTSNRNIGGRPWYYVPFWRQDVLADNDRVFTDPTPANADRLRDRYGVRWLFVDERFHKPAAGLDKVATLRFRDGDSTVYELTR